MERSSNRTQYQLPRYRPLTSRQRDRCPPSFSHNVSRVVTLYIEGIASRAINSYKIDSLPSSNRSLQTFVLPSLANHHLSRVTASRSAGDSNSSHLYTVQGIMGGKISRFVGRLTGGSVETLHDTRDCLDKTASESGVSVGWCEDESLVRSDDDTLSQSSADKPSSSRETSLDTEWVSCDSLEETDIFGDRDSDRTPDNSMHDGNGSRGTACQHLDQHLWSPGTLNNGCMTWIETRKQESPQVTRIHPEIDTTTFAVEAAYETGLVDTGGEKFVPATFQTCYLQNESLRDKDQPSLCLSPTWDQGNELEHPYDNAGATKSQTFKTFVGDTAVGSNLIGNTSFDESSLGESRCSKSSLHNSVCDDADGAVCLSGARNSLLVGRYSFKRAREGTTPSANTVVSCHGNSNYLNYVEEIQQTSPDSGGGGIKEPPGRQVHLSCRYVQQVRGNSVVKLRDWTNRSCSDCEMIHVERRRDHREEGLKEDLDKQRHSLDEEQTSRYGSSVYDDVGTNDLDNTTKYTSGVHVDERDLAVTCDFDNNFQPWGIPQNIVSGATKESIFGNTNSSHIICTVQGGSHNLYSTDQKATNIKSRSLMPVPNDRKNTGGRNGNASQTIGSNVQIHTNENDYLEDNPLNNILRSAGKNTSGFCQKETVDTCAGIPGSILVESMKLPSNVKPPTDKGTHRMVNLCASVEETSKLTRCSRLGGKLAGTLPSRHIKNISRGGNTVITEYCNIDSRAELQRDGETFDRHCLDSSVEVSQPNTVTNGDYCFVVTTGALSVIQDTPSNVSNKHFLLGNVFKCSPSVPWTTGSIQTTYNTRDKLDRSAEVIYQPSLSSSSFQAHETDPKISNMKEKVNFHNLIDAVSDLAVYDQAHPSVINGLSLATSATARSWTQMCASSPLDELEAQLFLISGPGLKATDDDVEVCGQYLDQARAIKQLSLVGPKVICNRVTDNHNVPDKRLTNQSFRDYHREMRAAEPAGKPDELTVTRLDNLSSSVIRELYDNDYDFSTSGYSTESKPHTRHRLRLRKRGQMKASSLWTLQEEPENETVDMSSPNPLLGKSRPPAERSMATVTIPKFLAGQTTLERQELMCPRRFEPVNTKFVQLSSLGQRESFSPDESSVCAKNSCTYSLRTEPDTSSDFGRRLVPLAALPGSANQGRQAHVSTRLANSSITESNYVREVPDGLSVLDRLSMSLAQFDMLNPTTESCGSECQRPGPKEAPSTSTQQTAEKYPQPFESAHNHGFPRGHSYTTCREERAPNGGGSLYSCTGSAEVRTTTFPDYDNTTETLRKSFRPDIKNKTAVVRNKRVQFKQSVDTWELSSDPTEDSPVLNSDHRRSGDNGSQESSLRVLYKDFTAAESEKAQNHACNVAQDQAVSNFRLKRFLCKSHSKQKSGRRLIQFLSKLGCISESACCQEESPKKISQKVAKKSKRSSKLTISDPVLIRSTSFRHHSFLVSSLHTSIDNYSSPSLYTPTDNYSSPSLHTPTDNYSSPSLHTPTDNYSSPSSSNHSFDSEPSIADSAYSSISESDGLPNSLGIQCLSSSSSGLRTPTASSSPVKQPCTSSPLLGGKTFPGDPTASHPEVKMLHVDADSSECLTSNCYPGPNPDRMSTVSDIIEQLEICESEIDTALLDHLRHGHIPAH